MKKKYSLFTILTIILLLVVVATYFIAGRDGKIVYLPLGDVMLNYIQAFYYFFDTAIFIFVVGGFYGFLNRVPAYKKLVKGLAEKFNKKELIFVIITTITFALISSLTGLNLLLLIFIPFVISIILLLGYDKLVALSATIGGTIAGFIGGIFTIFKDTSDYKPVYSTIERIVGLDSIWKNVFPKVLLFVVITGLLIFYIISHIKNVEEKKTKYRLTKSDNLFVEAKDRTGKTIKVDDSKTRVWPLVTLLILFFIILVLGYFPWNDMLKIDIFEKFHTWLLGLKIGKYEVFNSLISTQFTSFGSWASLGNYMIAIIALTILTFIIKLIYRIKFEDAMDGFLYGAKKMLPAAMLVMLAYTVLVCVYNNGFSETIIKLSTKEFGDNAIIHSLISAVGSMIHIDSYYTTNGIFVPIVSRLTETANLSVYAIMFQSIFGLVQLVGPTSIILLVGITYLDVPYQTWLKYIWRFIIELIIVIVLVLMIITLL